MTVFDFLKVYVYMEPESGSGDREDELDRSRAFVEGDQDAFHYFYEKYSGPLFNFVMKYRWDQELAEEVVQDAFVRLMKYRHNIKPERGVRSYLYTIALNLIRDRLRLSREKDYSLDRMEDDIGQMPAAGGSTEQKLEMKEMESFLEKVIDRMPEKLKTVILLRKVESMRVKDIVDVLGCSERTVTRQMDAAFKFILAEFEAAGYAKEGEILW